MKLFLPLLLAGVHTVAINAEETTMDLYIREKFVNSTGDECGSCTEDDGGDGSCFLSTRSFFLQHSCFNRNDQRASVYGEVEEGIVCRQEYREDSCEDEDIVFDIEDEDDCRDMWKIDECEDSEHMKKLGSWCTSSATGPVGEFTIPMLTFKEYAKVEDCGSDDYLHLLLPDEGGLCFPLVFRSGDGTYITGSRKVSCDGSVFNAVRYKSADCSGEALSMSYDGISDECPTDPSSGDGSIYTNDCSAPAVYCKPLEFNGVTIGNELADGSVSAIEGGDAESSADVRDTMESNADDRDTEAGETLGESAVTAIAPASLLVVGLALLSWMA